MDIAALCLQEKQRKGSPIFESERHFIPNNIVVLVSRFEETVPSFPPSFLPPSPPSCTARMRHAHPFRHTLYTLRGPKG
eukprot:8764300-Pyramimonas_sp.AAC.1